MPPHAERIYVSAFDASLACGIFTHHLDHKYRPDTWTSPRDFKLSGDSHLLFALDSLPDLVAALKESQPDAAEKLHTWYIEQLVATRAGLPALPTVPAPTIAPPPAPPESWANRWEREHE